MFRRVLTAYLAFVTAAAPCLCCCTTGRLFAATPRPVDPTPPVSTCCCHKSESAADPTPAPPPNVPEQRCPCRDHTDKQAQVTAGPAAAELALVLAAFEAASVAIPTLEPASAADLVGLVAFHKPSLSASDLLDAHHRLRC